MEAQKPALGCTLAPPIPKGTAVTDVRLKKWIFGKSIGAGAFGAVYLASLDGGEEEYVAKVEPHSNGPLWVEMHAFLRLGLDQHRAGWKPRSRKPVGWVGIPHYAGHGSFNFEGEKLRFLVMSRLGSDIQKFFQSGEKPLPLTTALNVSIQVLESLEYIHSKSYCHNDIKAQNILLGYGQDQDSVYLVDFGLACKYRNNQGFHCDSSPDERFAHEGTMEYTSRDGHTGVHSRRGDLESLAYNLVHWVTGYLPWTNSDDAEWVQSQKIGFMYNVPGFLKRCFKPNPTPKVIEDFLVYVNSLEFDSDPDYSKLNKLFCQAMRKEGVEPYSALIFSNKRRPEREESSDEEDFSQEETRNTRSQDDETRYAPWSWEQVLSLDPESIIRQASRTSDALESEDPDKAAAFEQLQEESLENPTPEMRKLLEAREQLEMARQQLSWKEQLNEYNQRTALAKAKFASMDLTPSALTPAMEEVIARRAERLASGLCSPITPEPSEDEEDDLTDTRRGKSQRKKPAAKNSVSPSSKSGSVTPKSKGRGESVTPRSRATTPRSTPASRTPTPVTVERMTRSRTSSRAASPEPTATPRRTTRSRASSRAASPELAATPRTRGATRSISGTNTPELSTSPTVDDVDSAGTGRVTRLSKKVEKVEKVTRSSRKAEKAVITKSAKKVEDVEGETQFKLPIIDKVTCTTCGKRLMERSLPRHIANVHKDDLDAESDSEVKRSLSERSPKTPIMSLKRLRDQRHCTPQPNQEQEILHKRNVHFTPKNPLNGLRNPGDVGSPGTPTGNGLEECPLCLLKLPRHQIPLHFTDVHSPARKITRQVKVEAHGIPVHVSTDSPCKIRNVDSPVKDSDGNTPTPFISVSEAVKIRRELGL